jgi:O-antigen/teichoic acid export membrane protein
MAISQIKKNIVANFISRFIGFVITYLFTPLFIKLLGIESFGFIGFFSALMGVLLITDIGLTASLTREAARLSVLDDSEKLLKDTIRTYELIYICLSLFIACMVWFGSNYIANNWLKVKDLDLSQLVLAIKISGIAIACQLPSGLYFGGLMGLQKQILANSVQLGWSLSKGLGTVIVLWLISSTILAFAICQLIGNFLYFVVLRKSLWGSLPFNNKKIVPIFDFKVFLLNWKYSIGIAAISFMSTIILQADKIIVSKALPLEVLGYYTLAGTLAMLPIMIANPITSAMFPKFIALIELKDSEQLVALYHRTCKLVAVTVLPLGFTVMAFTENILKIWVGSSLIAGQSALVASIMLFGQILQVITTVAFYFSLAIGKTKLPIMIQILSIVVFIPSLFFLLHRYGIIGASLSYLIMNLITCPIYMYFFHRNYLPGQLINWLKNDVFLPIIIIIPFVIVSRFILPNSNSVSLILLKLFFTWFLSSLFILLAFSEFRGDIYLKFIHIKSKIFKQN